MNTFNKLWNLNWAQVPLSEVDQDDHGPEVQPRAPGQLSFDTNGWLVVLPVLLQQKEACRNGSVLSLGGNSLSLSHVSCHQPRLKGVASTSKQRTQGVKHQLQGIAVP